MSDEGRRTSSRSVATVRRTRWPGWIWSVPIAALIVVTWLGVRALTSGGTEITILFDDASGLKNENSHVVYRGVTVGRVTRVELTKEGNAAEVTAEIEESASPFLRTKTRFWLKGAEPSIGNPESLGAILAGPTIVMEPGAGEKATHFTGLERKPIQPMGEVDSQRCWVQFDGAVGALKSGDPVKLRGFTVGQVDEVHLRIDAATGKITTPATLTLFRSLLHVRDVPDAAGGGALRATVAALIDKGLQARLERDPPLIGEYAVSLEMTPQAHAGGQSVVNGLPQIPALSGGGLDAIVERVNDVPLEQISRNVLAISRQLKTLVSSPELDDSLHQLHAAVKQIRRTAASAGAQIRQTASKLRNTADRLEAVARSAQDVVGGPTSQDGLRKAVEEATYAIRTIRALADYLDRHPEALVRGRSEEE